MSTAIPGVLTAFEAALAATAGLSGVSISRGEPATDRPREGIIFGDARATREYASLGIQPSALDEEVSLDFGAWVVVNGGAYADAETRMWVIFDALEGKLRTDLSLNGAWMFSRLTSIERKYVPVDKGRASQVTFTCLGRARI